MVPTSLVLVVCHALSNQGPLDVNGFPIDGVKLDEGTCRNEVIQMYDQTEVDSLSEVPDFSDPYVCSRMAMSESANWEHKHPGWFVKRVKCPHPDGTFPGDTPV